MDKNTVTGLLLIMAILIGYGIWTRPSKEEMERMQRERDSIVMVNRAEQARKAEDMRKADELAKFSLSDISDNDSLRQSELQDRFGVFAQAVESENQFIIMENDLMKLRIATQGGRPYSVELKNYKRHDKTPLILFDGDSTVFGFRFFAQNRSIVTNNLFFEPQTEKSHILVEGDSATLVMRLNAGEESYIEYRYTMKSNDYMMGFDVNMQNINKLLPGNQNIIDFDWQMYSPRQEKGAKNENQYTSLYYKYYQSEVDDLSAAKDNDRKQIATRLDWIVFKQQFFSWGLVANQSFANADLQFTRQIDQNRFSKKFDALIGMKFESNQDYQTIPMSLYFGPNHYKTLKKYDVELERLVFLGRNIIRVVNRFVTIPIFNWLGSFINSYWLIILLMTIIIKACLLPLTFKSYMSTARMRVLKPQIDEINQRIPKDKPMERQQATMALYKKVGVSPMGGCLPMLLSMPILFAMFRLFPTAIELRQQSFLWAKDLSTYDSILDLPFVIPFYGDHISLFTLLMSVTTIISMRMSSGQQMDTSAMPGMKTMMYIMPIMLIFVLNDFSAGLTYYYFISNVITIGQNELFKRSVDEAKILAKLNANSAKPVKKSKFQQRLEQMQKQQQEMMKAKKAQSKKK